MAFLLLLLAFHGPSLAAAAACDGLDGEYSVNGTTVSLRTNSESTAVLGHWADTEQPAFTGTLAANCFGTLTFPDARQYQFRYHGGAIAWSSGDRWSKVVEPTEDRSEADSRHAVSHAHHGEVHGEHGKEDLKVPVTVAIMLFGMLAMGVGLVCLVNFRDADVRCSVYNMVSNTMSILIAVLMNQAIFTFLVEQALESPWPRGLGIDANHLVKCCVGALVFFVMWATLSKMCWSCRENANYLYSISHLGSHLCAFAGMYASGEALRCGNFRSHGSLGLTCLIVLGTACILLVLRYVSRRCRKRWCSAKQHEAPTHGSDSQAEHVEHDASEHAFRHGEDEAIVLVLSFLLNQLICQWLIGKLPNLHGHEESGLDEIRMMAAFAAGIFAAFVGLAVLMHCVQNGINKYLKDCITVILNILGMSFCWCVMLASAWGMRLFFHRFPIISYQLVYVINAFFVTVLGAGAVVGLDRIADRFNSTEDGKCKGDDAERGLLGVGDVGELGEAAAGALEKAIRHVMISFGLLVALSWDKAFDAAEETIVEFVGTHRVICKGVIACLLVLLVAPAWTWYVVPAARKTEEQHRAELASPRKSRESQRKTTENPVLLSSEPRAKELRS